jgi:tetratricopeptide (TPR) repeat protein
MGYRYAKIHPNGNAYRCCIIQDDGYLGNLLDGTFSFHDAPAPCTYSQCSCWAAMILGEEDRWGGHWRKPEMRDPLCLPLPADDARRLDLAQQLQAQGSHAQAGEILKGLQELYPSDIQVLGALAAARREEGRIEEAFELAGSAMRLSPGNPWLRRLLAHILCAMQRFTEAEEHYRKALADEKEDAASRACSARGLAHICLMTERPKDALSFIEQARKLDPGMELDSLPLPPAAEERLALARKLRSEDRSDEAIRILGELRASYPQDARILGEISEIRFSRGELDSALAEASEAVRLHPGNSCLRRIIAEVFLAMKRFAQAEEHYRKALADEKEDAASRACSARGLAHICLMTERPKDALSFIEQARRLDPGMELDSLPLPPAAEERLSLARKLRSEDRSDEALQLLNELRADYPQDARILGEISELRFSLGELDSALAEASEAVRLHPGNSCLRRIIAEVFLAMKRFTEAEEHYRKALADEKEDAASRACSARGLAHICLMTERPKEALSFIEQARRLDPGMELDSLPLPPAAEERLALARKLRTEDRSDEALQLLNELRADYPQDARILGEISEIRFSRGELDSALAEASEAVRLHPGNSCLRRIIAEVFLAMKRFAQAEEHYRKALADEKEDAASRACSARGLAHICLMTERPKEALSFIEQARRLDPGMELDSLPLPPAEEERLSLARKLRSEDRSDEALQLLGELRASYPQDARILGEISELRFSLGELDSALAQASEAVRLHPGNSWLQRTLANVCRAMKKPREAEKHYLQALEHCEEDSLAKGVSHMGLACICLETGRPQKAREHIDAALALCPENVFILGEHRRIFAETTAS